MDWLRLEIREQHGFRWNHALLAVLFLCFWIQWLVEDRRFTSLTLTGWSFPGLITHPFIHVHSLHLAWNLVLLHILGGLVVNALGPLGFAGAWLAFTLAGAAGHLLAGGAQAAGASGVISGFAGLVVAGRLGGSVALLDASVRVPVTWLVLALVSKDIVLAFLPGMGVAVGGHLGGYLAGSVAGFLWLKFRPHTV